MIREAKRSLLFKEVSADRVSHILGNVEVGDEYDYADHIHMENGTEVVVNEFWRIRGGYSVPRAWAVENYPHFDWQDGTVSPTHKLKFTGRITPRDQRQELFFEELIKEAEKPGPRNILANASTGCHAPGTLIMMASGYPRPVENIRSGDYVMGPDSRPRRVMRIIQGAQQMYRVTPHRGFKPFEVNEDHILSLVRTRSFYGERGPSRQKQQAGEILNISVKDYLASSDSFKHLYKLRQVAIDYSPNETPIDPYILGAWLGDGLSKTGAICGVDDEVLDAFSAYAHSIGCSIRVEYENKLKTVFTTGPLFSLLKELDLINNKHIPLLYLVNDEQSRLELLAGLMDTDGHLSKSTLEITQVNYRLATEIQRLARSLGFRCSMSVKRVGHTDYFRMNISGELNRIPTKIPRKQAAPRRQKKNHLVTGFTVEPVGVGDYYGFTLDGDHLYVTADHIVHHNSGKTVAGIYLGWQLSTPTLIVVDSNKIASGWLKNFRQFFGQGWTDRRVGRAQQDTCDYQGKAFVIAMAQSLARRNYGREFYNHFGLVVVDEVQVFGGPHFSPILHMFPAKVRAHFTAQNRGGSFGKLIKCHTGKPNVVSSQEVLKPDAWIIKNTLTSSFYALSDGALLSNLSKVEDRNQKLAKLIKQRGYDRGRNVLVLSNRTAQLQHLKQLCRQLGIPDEAMGIHAGTYDTEKYVLYYLLPGSTKRNRLRVVDTYGRGRTVIRHLENGDYSDIEKFPMALYNRLQAGEEIRYELARERYSPTQAELDDITHLCDIIFATYEIFSKGVDVPRLDMGVEALPSGNVTQPVGRVLRLLDGKAKPEWYAIHDVVELPTDPNNPFPKNDRMAEIMTKYFNGKTAARIKALKAKDATVRRA